MSHRSGLLAGILLAVLRAGCGEDKRNGSEGAGFRLSANIALSFQTQNAFSSALSLRDSWMPTAQRLNLFATKADAIVSLPYVKGQTMGYGASYIKTGIVDSSGKATIEIQKTESAS